MAKKLTNLRKINFKGCYRLTHVGLSAIFEANASLESIFLEKLHFGVNMESITTLCNSCPDVKYINVAQCQDFNEDRRE